MKAEYIITRQGKEFVLYEGLLDEAHNQGLKRITTTLIQIPNADNANMAVVQAEVETERGRFSGIGDASPQNVNKMIVPHLLRMAETRAKARALRDAINVGQTALEELGGDESGAPDEGKMPTDMTPGITEKQGNFLKGLARDCGVQVNLAGIDQREVDELIQGLKGLRDSGVAFTHARVSKTPEDPSRSGVLPFGQGEVAPPADYPRASDQKAASANQLATIVKLCNFVGQQEPPGTEGSMSAAEASEHITRLSRAYNERKQKVRS